MSDFDTFAYRVELLRKEMGKEVAGIFFAKSGYQLGAIKAGEHEGVDVVVCAQDQIPNSFVLTFERYDAERAKRRREGAGFFTVVSDSNTSLDRTIIRANGSTEKPPS